MEVKTIVQTHFYSFPSEQEMDHSYIKSSHVKLLITNNAFCIVQSATAQSKTGIFRDCGVAEAPPGFQAG
jgi:hypothetical protein